MGTCFGQFKKKSKGKRLINIPRCFYFRNKDRVEFELLVDGELKSSFECIPEMPDVWCTDRLNSALITKHFENSPSKKHIYDSEEVSSLWRDGEASQLLPLDAHSLLATRALQVRKISWSSATPPSSLELEWENEGGLSGARASSRQSSISNPESSSCCPGESPTSLEWDPCTDVETEQLIREIEDLAANALKETGTWEQFSPAL